MAGSGRGDRSPAEGAWARWRQIDKNLDAYAARRSRETTVFVLEPPAAVGEAPQTNAGTSSSRKIVLAVTCTAIDSCTLRLRHTT